MNKILQYVLKLNSIYDFWSFPRVNHFQIVQLCIKQISGLYINFMERKPLLRGVGTNVDHKRRWVSDMIVYTSSVQKEKR